MSDEQRKPEIESQEFLASPCPLSELKKRSQIDFEIDFFERILSRDPNYTDVLLQLGELFSRKRWHRRALQVDQRLAQLHPRDPFVLYNLGCSYAVLNRSSEAIAALRSAIQSGYADFEHMRDDHDLDSLRPNPEFIRLLQECEPAASPGPLT